MKSINSCVILNNGIKMPVIGFGTYQLRDRYEIDNSIKEALRIGYRHIDTASFYNNEEMVGLAIQKSQILRDEIFLVSKVWNSEQGYEETLKAFKNSIKKLKTEYLDAYLIHWPQQHLSKETWRALEKLYKEGYVRAIGVSNFTSNHLKELIENAEIIPLINQIEFHPKLVDCEIIRYCKKQNIQLEAWSPLIRGRVFEINLLRELAKKYNKTISQIVLRWDLQMGVVAIPKTASLKRMKENSEIFDFEINKKDMKEIERLNCGFRIGADPKDVYYNPELITD